MKEFFIKRYNSKSIKLRIIRIIVISALSALIPFAVTFFMSGKSELLYNIYEPVTGGNFVLISEDEKEEKSDVEKFIPCILMARMDITAEEEALKAMAVIIRTQIMKKLEGLTSISTKELGLDYISYDDLKKKWGNDFAENYNYMMKIVNNTSCRVIKYEGELISPEYHEVSGGKTRNGTLPYLRQADSEEDYASDDYLNITYYTNKEFCDILKNPEGISADKPLETFQITRRDESGYILKLHIGSADWTGEEFAKLFKLNSTYFQAEEFNGNVRIVTRGKGSGYGLSIFGANVFAAAGQSYVQILNHYYAGTVIG